MFRKQFAFAVSFLAALLLLLPLAATSANAKESKTISTTMHVLNSTSLGGKAVKPGTYRVIADGSTVTMKMGKKVVAEAPMQWKDGDGKSPYSSIVKDAQGIKEFHFEGKSRYIEVRE